MKKTLILIFFILTCVDVYGQPGEDKYYKSDTFDIKKKVQVMILPVVFYTPETQFGFGAGLQTFIYSKSNIYNSRESNILVTGMYTTRKQFMLDIFPKIYFNLGDLFLDGLIKYRLFPNRFWGIGNNSPDANEENYNMETISIEAAILKRLPPSLNFGFQYKYDNYTMLETAEG